MRLINDLGEDFEVGIRMNHFKIRQGSLVVIAQLRRIVHTLSRVFDFRGSFKK